MLRTHLTALETSARRCPRATVFKLPRSDSPSNHAQDWHSITYRQFHSDVESSARYWSFVLAENGVSAGSVVGLWIGGYTYSDVLNIYGISRAGFIPQLFSLRLPSAEVIFELLTQSNAKAVIYETAFAGALRESPVPAFMAASPEDLCGAAEYSLCALVPCSYRWLDSAAIKSSEINVPRSPDRQDVTVWMGSMCHIGQTFMLIGSLQHGSCVIQPTQIGFSAEELCAMVHRCGLNRLNQFAAFLASHLRASRTDPKLLSLLCGLDEVLYSGMPLPREEEEWAYRSGIKLRNLFGSTEAGATLRSVGGTESTAALLQPLQGTSYRFIPVTEGGASAYQSTARLVEFVISADSPDCPHPSLRNQDGHFHTGDLFQEVAPGKYISKGRADDWIKSENSLRCDTKSIEDNARMQCGPLISECVVVGSGRPSPVLFVEPGTDMDSEKLKKEIIRKTRQFHSRRYLHERITSTDKIVVVPPKTLPRTLTKGNIRRMAVEETFKALLDEIHAP
ncbi:unnamed protein product [Mycena citricolor]|uniref:Acetyl-CoA synthetase-like protein n=1 Tax=Mycena citricolor TaxID=2018698 RepID=A0AAD2HSK6_9AGAR|nr:unnamed protein product [Mycena citricolor]